jgi:hypothetical protein
MLHAEDPKEEMKLTIDQWFDDLVETERNLLKEHRDVGMCNHILYTEVPKSLQFLTSVWTEEPHYSDPAGVATRVS